MKEKNIGTVLSFSLLLFSRSRVLITFLGEVGEEASEPARRDKTSARPNVDRKTYRRGKRNRNRGVRGSNSNSYKSEPIFFTKLQRT